MGQYEIAVLREMLHAPARQVSPQWDINLANGIMEEIRNG